MRFGVRVRKVIKNVLVLQYCRLAISKWRGYCDGAIYRYIKKNIYIYKLGKFY